MSRRTDIAIFIGALTVGIFCRATGSEKNEKPPIRCEAPEMGVPPSPQRAPDLRPRNPLRSPSSTSTEPLQNAPASTAVPPTVPDQELKRLNETPPLQRIPFEGKGGLEEVVPKDSTPNEMKDTPGATSSDENLGAPKRPVNKSDSGSGKSEAKPATTSTDRINESKADKSQEEPELPTSERETVGDRAEADKVMREVKTPAIEASTKKVDISSNRSPSSAPKSGTIPPNKPTTKAPTKPTNSERPLSASERQLKARVENCLAYYLFRPESTVKRSPWAVMHALLPYGVEAELINGNQKVNAIGWMCYNGKCRTQKLFVPKEDGFALAVGPGVQGHEGQFLAMLAQSYVPSNFPIRVEGKNYSVRDLIQYEMAGCKEKSELTFKLIGLSHYLPSDQVWVANDRKNWTISKIIEEELAQTIVGAACGGTHRLMGLTYAVQRREEEGLPIDGNFQRAAHFVRDFVQYSMTLQNPDGSFSTNWFESRGDDPDMDRKVQTSGHILEWLIYTLPEESMTDPRIVRGVNFLLSQIFDRRDHDWAIGPRGHSLRALALYDQKRFGAVLGEQRKRFASVQAPQNQRR